MFSKVFGRVFDYNFGKVFKPLQLQDDPVPDYLVKYALDFTDRGMVYNPSTPTGANDMDYFRSAPACNDGIGGFFNGTDRDNLVDGDSGKIAIGTGAFTILVWINTINTTGAKIKGIFR